MTAAHQGNPGRRTRWVDGAVGVRRLVGVRFAGVVGEDEPDPRLRWHEQARDLPMSIVGLVPQPHLEDWGAIGVGSGTRNGVLDSCEASISYTLWRNPDERDDPVNLAELDEQQRRALEAAPPWPRPSWLVEQVRRMRYPMLWECVRTQWSREPGGYGDVPTQLVAHVNHILVNQFRHTGVVDDDDPAHGIDGPVDERCVEARIPVLVDGTARNGFRIDTDPHVYGLAVDLDPHSVLTAAIPRDALPYLQIAFTSAAASPQATR
jgi:hypothetical protein